MRGNDPLDDERRPSVAPAAPDYLLGRSPEEYTRLTMQARILRPYTERFFRAAGLVSGMRVLDIGSGMGDVAMLAGDIVGPGGIVVGVDSDPDVLDKARQRALQHGCSTWVTFDVADVDAFGTTDVFDALVGRYILLYLPDAAATIRRLLSNLRPGGIVAFHDAELTDPSPSHPPSVLWDRSCELIRTAFERVGAPITFGRRLGETFLRAGLPFPTLVTEGAVGGGRGSYLYSWLASSLISVEPRLAALGLVVPPELAPLETLAARMEAEAVGLGSQVAGPVQFGAWARKPLAS